MHKLKQSILDSEENFKNALQPIHTKIQYNYLNLYFIDSIYNMDNLPEIVRDKININIHELKFVDTLNVVKHLFDDDIELIPNEETNTITPTDISQSDVETEFSSETSVDRFTHEITISKWIDIYFNTVDMCVQRH